MAVYRCSVCGYIFDEEKEGKKYPKLRNVRFAAKMCQTLFLLREKKRPRRRKSFYLSLNRMIISDMTQNMQEMTTA